VTTQHSTPGSTPSADAFYLPADACRQAQMWLPWPDAPHLQDSIVALAQAAAAFGPVRVIANPGQEKAARTACGVQTVRDVVALAHTSPRLRDIGPTFLVDGKGGSAAVDWRFNGWGERAPAADATFAHALLGAVEVRRFRAPLTLEGSSFTADGRGTLLALSPAIFDPARNPDLAQLEAFGIFQNWLGVARVIWLPEAHPGDTLNTDLRALAAFISPECVAVTAGEDGTVLARAAAHLARARNAQGKFLDLLRLPAPPRAESRLRSYTNFVVMNGGILMPAFDAPSDTRAADMLADVFPGRVIAPVPAAALADAGLTLSALALPHPARLLERDRATVLPRAAWDQPVPDAEALLQKYIDMAESET
jgi:agmatine deiminase